MSHYLSNFRAPCLGWMVGMLGAFPAFAGQPTQVDKPAGHIEIIRQMTYAAGSPESAQVLEWIKMVSPAYAPLLKPGQITVTRYTRTNELNSPQLQSRASTLSPLPLPTSGVNGERYQVNHDLPDGNRESWTYEWQGGGGGGGSWVTVDYSYHRGSGEGERPSPRQELRR